MSTPTIDTPAADTIPAGQNAGGPQPSGAGPNLVTPEPRTEPDLCGAPHEYKTPKGETRTKPCIKARGHEGAHSSRAKSEKVDLSALTLDALEVEEAPTDELLDVLSERVRDEKQQRVDADVLKGYEKWVKAGKPAGANEAIKLGAASRYRVAPENVAGIRVLLRRAENAPDVKAKKIHVRILPAKKHIDGTMLVYFISVDKSEARAAAHTPETPTTPPAVDTPSPAGPPAPPAPRPAPPAVDTPSGRSRR